MSNIKLGQYFIIDVFRESVSDDDGQLHFTGPALGMLRTEPDNW